MILLLLALLIVVAGLCTLLDMRNRQAREARKVEQQRLERLRQEEAIAEAILSLPLNQTSAVDRIKAQVLLDEKRAREARAEAQRKYENKVALVALAALAMICLWVWGASQAAEQNAAHARGLSVREYREQLAQEEKAQKAETLRQQYMMGVKLSPEDEATARAAEAQFEAKRAAYVEELRQGHSIRVSPEDQGTLEAAQSVLEQEQEANHGKP